MSDCCRFFFFKEEDGIRYVAVTGVQTCALPILGPFSQAVDELGQTYHRGKPEPVSARTAQLLKTPPFERLFLLSDQPVSLAATDQRLVSILPAQTPCVWKGHFALFTGPFTEVEDDDHHVYRRGIPVEICSQTPDVVEAPPYTRRLPVINLAPAGVPGAGASLRPGGTRRSHRP